MEFFSLCSLNTVYGKWVGFYLPPCLQPSNRSLASREACRLLTASLSSSGVLGLQCLDRGAWVLHRPVHYPVSCHTLNVPCAICSCLYLPVQPPPHMLCRHPFSMRTSYALIHSSPESPPAVP